MDERVKAALRKEGLPLPIESRVRSDGFSSREVEALLKHYVTEELPDWGPVLPHKRPLKR